MRRLMIFVAAGLSGAPALAETPARAADPVDSAESLFDPEIGERLSRMAQALSSALLDLPVGEVKAAAEGRPASAAEKGMTVRDYGRRDDPDFDRNVERQVAAAGPAIEASMKALKAAIPAMMEGMRAAREEIERASANIPRPDYPRR